MKIFCCLFIFLIFSSCQYKETDIQIKKLDYPSASAVEYFDGRLYIMGDDATALLVLDTNLNVLGQKPILSYSEKRISKEIKPDIEAS